MLWDLGLPGEGLQTVRIPQFPESTCDITRQDRCTRVVRSKYHHESQGFQHLQRNECQWKQSITNKRMTQRSGNIIYPSTLTSVLKPRTRMISECLSKPNWRTRRQNTLVQRLGQWAAFYLPNCQHRVIWVQWSTRKIIRTLALCPIETKKAEPHMVKNDPCKIT